MEGETRTLQRCKRMVGVEKDVLPVWVMGRELPSPTTMRVEELEGEEEERIPEIGRASCRERVYVLV